MGPICPSTSAQGLQGLRHCSAAATSAQGLQGGGGEGGDFPAQGGRERRRAEGAKTKLTPASNSGPRQTQAHVKDAVKLKPPWMQTGMISASSPEMHLAAIPWMISASQEYGRISRNASGSSPAHDFSIAGARAYFQKCFWLQSRV